MGSEKKSPPKKPKASKPVTAGGLPVGEIVRQPRPDLSDSQDEILRLIDYGDF